MIQDSKCCDGVVGVGILQFDPGDGILWVGDLVWKDGLVDGCDGCLEAELQNFDAYVGCDGFGDEGTVG